VACRINYYPRYGIVKEVAGVKFNSEFKNDTLIIRLEGELDLVTAEQFRQAAENEIKSKNAKRLILNLKEVPFIDSSGLGAILGRYKRISEKGGKMAVVEVKPQVERIFELSGIFRIMKLYESEERALAEM